MKRTMTRALSLMLVLMTLVTLFCLPVTTASAWTANATKKITFKNVLNSNMIINANQDLEISWPTVKGAKYYYYSVRDLTTDVKVIQHEETEWYSKTSFTLDSRYLVPGHQYRVWVGAFDKKTGYPVSVDPIKQAQFAFQVRYN